jgi:hypothetical protein
MRERAPRARRRRVSHTLAAGGALRADRELDGDPKNAAIRENATFDRPAALGLHRSTARSRLGQISRQHRRAQ